MSFCHYNASLYAKFLPKCNLEKNLGKLLWNTNYNTISPRFQTAWQEFKEHFDYELLAPEQTLEKFIEHSANRQSSYEYITSLLEEIQEVTLTIRPHPFESSKFYEQTILKDYQNTKISLVSDVQSDLLEHSLVLQYGCQTALDAFIRGVPSIKPNRDDINIWSKVTPYVDPIVLCEKLTDIFEKHGIL